MIGDILQYIPTGEIFVVSRIAKIYGEIDIYYINIYVRYNHQSEIFYHGGRIGEYLNMTKVLCDADLGI